MSKYPMLKRGMKGPDVVVYRRLMERVGYPLPAPEDTFGPRTEAATKSYQKKRGIAVTGVVDDIMMGLLHSEVAEMDGHMTPDVVDTYEEVRRLPALMPQTAVDRRMSDSNMLQQTCDNGQGLRYGGWINPYQFDGEAFRKGGKFPIPKVGKIQKSVRDTLGPVVHGGTCSPYAGFETAFWMCANEDFTRILAWNGLYIPEVSTEGEYVHDGDRTAFCRGFEEYCEVHGTRKFEALPLNVLYKYWEWLNQVNVVVYTSHVVFVLKVGGDDGFHLEDPANPGQPMKPCLLRRGADGFYTDGGTTYSGTKQTCRALTDTEKVGKPWEVWRLANLDKDNCCPTFGRYAGRRPWQMVLE
jgi:peptidoglycan hydrolase-like protein with peptidoglycan-binding domain